MSTARFYEGEAIIADPVHDYIRFTSPLKEHEKTERDLIDSPWLQRLRWIFQLQGTRWAFPSADHTRFQHALGAMHIGGRFGRDLHRSLAEVAPDCPSAELVEEVLRLAGLLHDVGHGPFGHFFDQHFLNKFGLTHEHVGGRIIEDELGPTIRAIRRSPHGSFRKGERVEPQWLAFLIKRNAKPPKGCPKWVELFKPLLDGIYTVDNLDYVLRDSYMCGVAVGPIDVDRLLYYSFFTDKGLTLHKAATAALRMFVNARWYLYSCVYYHRTTRAIEFHLQEIFPATMKSIFPRDPLKDLPSYQTLTDQRLLQQVQGWARKASATRQRLGQEWAQILNRKVKWKTAFEQDLRYTELPPGTAPLGRHQLSKRIGEALAQHGLGNVRYEVDMAAHDPRPVNPAHMGRQQICIYDPSTDSVSLEALADLLSDLPFRVVKCRVFTLTHDHDQEVTDSAREVLKALGGEALSTNV